LKEINEKFILLTKEKKQLLSQLSLNGSGIEKKLEQNKSKHYHYFYFIFFLN
jgi:hypothetical protein